MLIAAAKSRNAKPRGASHHPAFGTEHVFLVVQLVPVFLVLLKVVRILRGCETRLNQGE